MRSEKKLRKWRKKRKDKTKKQILGREPSALIQNVLTQKNSKMKILYKDDERRWWSRRMELTFPHKHIKNTSTYRTILLEN